MLLKLTRTVLIGAILAAYAGARPAVCEAWSLFHPFSSDDQAAKKPVARSVQKPPSAWDKVTTGTKNFFSKTGEAVGLKKPEPKKPVPQCAYVRPQVIQKKKPESKSWFSSWFKPEEPEKRTDVVGWMKSTQPITP
jgi:hypothetical protein